MTHDHSATESSGALYADTRFETRRRKLAAAFANHRLDSFLTVHGVHVYYLSGFTGSNGGLIVNKDLSATIATDGRYTTQIAEQVPDIECVQARACGKELVARVTGPRRIGVEAEHLSASVLEQLRGAAGDGVQIVPVSGLVEDVRLRKDRQELDDLAAVADLASTALAGVLEAGELAVGRTERDVAADLEYRMRRLGASKTSFDTIIASGPNSAKPHHGAGDRVIERGDLVTIDFGALKDGYNSDCTRTFVMGYASDKVADIYDVVLRSQLAGVDAAVAGARLSDVDKVCRDIIADAGYGEYFVHSTGHGIGLDVHEPPYAATTGQGVLEPGMTLTIEPGVYVPGVGGVRIEDTLIIGQGQPRVITTLPKELTIIGD